MAITVTHTFEIIAGSPAEYTTLLSQVAGYIAAGLNPGEVLVSQNNQGGPRKITVVIRTTQGTL